MFYRFRTIEHFNLSSHRSLLIWLRRSKHNFFRVLPSERKLILFLALPLLELVVRGQEQGLLVVRHLGALGAADATDAADGSAALGRGGSAAISGRRRLLRLVLAVSDLSVRAVALVAAAYK